MTHQYVVIVRHGERLDDVEPNFPHADPPLTDKGKAAIALVADSIRNAAS